MMLGSDLGGEADYCRLTPPGCPILIDSLLLFTVSGDSGQTVRGSLGSANAWPGVRSFSRCLGLHQTGGAVGAPLGATAQPIILAF